MQISDGHACAPVLSGIKFVEDAFVIHLAYHMP